MTAALGYWGRKVAVRGVVHLCPSANLDRKIVCARAGNYQLSVPCLDLKLKIRVRTSHQLNELEKGISHPAFHLSFTSGSTVTGMRPSSVIYQQHPHSPSGLASWCCRLLQITGLRGIPHYISVSNIQTRATIQRWWFADTHPFKSHSTNRNSKMRNLFGFRMRKDPQIKRVHITCSRISRIRVSSPVVS